MSDTNDEEPAWYAIIGRIPGADEDDCRLYGPCTRDAAVTAFRAAMLEGEDEEAITEAYGASLYINHVLRSDTEIEST